MWDVLLSISERDPHSFLSRDPLTPQLTESLTVQNAKGDANVWTKPFVGNINVRNMGAQKRTQLTLDANDDLVLMDEINPLGTMDDFEITQPEKLGNKKGVFSPNRVFDFSKTLG